MSYFSNKRQSSGIFFPIGNKYAEFKGDTGNGSINSIIEKFGYHTDQIYSPVMGSGKDKILYLGLEVFTRNVAFVLTSKGTTFITQKNINKSLEKFSVTKDFDGYKISKLLADAVEHNSYSVEFLGRVLKLNDISRNGMFYSEKINTYLYFTEGILTDFHFDDGLFPYARHLKEGKPRIFNRLADHAHKYWPDNDFQAKKEINIQCEAWANIPNAFGNEFIPLHRTENDGANLHMIRVCHYNYPMNIIQFKEINHGRYEVINEDGTNNILSVEILFTHLIQGRVY